jgi:hypothetical protein
MFAGGGVVVIIVIVVLLAARIGYGVIRYRGRLTQADDQPQNPNKGGGES